MASDPRQAGSLWTPEEDLVLLNHVAKYGTKHWGFLQTSGVLPHRDQKACCNRFILLKRKFFQARSKGQRLTFPVVPQPDSPSADSRRMAPPLGRVSSPAPLSPSATSFKRSSPSLLSRSASPEPKRLKEDCPSVLDFDGTPLTLEAVWSGLSQRRSEGGRGPAPLARGDAGSGVLSVPGTSFGGQDQPNGLTPRLGAAPSAAAARATSLASALSSSTQSAAWQCLNLVTNTLPELHTADCGPLPSWLNQGDLSPDALLDQIASAPRRMFFGSNPAALPESLADAPGHAVDMDTIARSQAGGLDLWDLLCQ